MPYELALKLKQLGFDEPCLANLIGFSDGTKENGRYKINHQQVFYPNDYTSFDDKSEELGLTPLGICGVPLFQQAFRWFREKHKLFVSIEYSTRSQTDFVITINKIPVNDARDEDYKTYEVAELAALDKMSEIVEIKQRQPNIPEWDGPYSF